MGRFAIVAAALCVVAPAHATSFVFTGGNSATSGSTTNSRTFTFGGITVTATAWSTGGLTSATTPAQAYTGWYSNGLGVTTTAEGNGQTNNSHTIDNVGQYDFIRLEFSTAVSLTGLTMTGYDVNGAPQEVDGDYWVSYGTGTNAFNTSALWQGYIDRGTNKENGTSYSNPNFSKVWLIGAGRTSTDRDDGFKLSTVNVVTPPAVPEPATWLTMILGFGGIGTIVRRRAALMAKVKALLMAGLGRKLLTGPIRA